MSKYSSKLIEFRFQYELYEQAIKEAKKRGYSSVHLYAKALLSSSLEYDSETEIYRTLFDEINQLRNEIDKLWEVLQTEQKKEFEFRENVEQTLAAILTHLQKSSTTTVQQQPVSQPSFTQNNTKSLSQTNSFIDRYPNRRK